MLEFFFEEARTLRRLRSGLTGQHIDGFAEYLRGRQYARWTGRGYLRAVAHLGIWMERSGIAIENLNEQVLKGFFEHLPCCACLRRNRGIYGDAGAGTAHFLAYLREHGILSAPLPVVCQVPELVTAFEYWMRNYRGVRESTLVTYRTALLELIASLGPYPAQYEAGTIRQVVMTLSNRHGRSRAKTVVTAVRMLLRFAASHAMFSASLADAVPTIAEWRLSSLPQRLARGREQLIASCDPAAVKGFATAILLLLARLGLRAGDVAGLRMRDIDWQRHTLHLDGKGRREVLLPVPKMLAMPYCPTSNTDRRMTNMIGLPRASCAIRPDPTATRYPEWLTARRAGRRCHAAPWRPCAAAFGNDGLGAQRRAVGRCRRIAASSKH